MRLAVHCIRADPIYRVDHGIKDNDTVVKGHPERRTART